jgi:hypothetical protein
MSKYLIRMILLALGVGLFATVGYAAPKPAGPAAPKNETYVVVQVGTEVQVVKKSELAGLKKSLQKPPMDGAKKTGTASKPVKLKVLRNSLKTQQDANDWMEKYLQEQEEKGGGTTKTKTNENW